MVVIIFISVMFKFMDNNNYAGFCHPTTWDDEIELQFHMCTIVEWITE